MPKIVDHDARRAEIVQATWRVIARNGIEATTMRGLADELGVANGALAVYFPSKRAILAAAFRHIFDVTSRRYADERARGLRGAAALRAFLEQLFPLDEERLLESRIVIPFLEYAAHDPDMRALYLQLMSQWESEFADLLAEMSDAGEISVPGDRRAYIDHLLATTNGVQASAVLMPETATPDRLSALIDSLLLAAR
ncbi:hypothetical protein HMPREF1529_01105 [Microbacterium sp. oral taxon 186 str. F0373]|uniref:TetR/AcrR family transcriptional regulator n=1 Tax=Microbacterium sp. oral taxon 186 TaxID=712383 RepID=UPI00034E7C37|nr:TetR family transcriptional regulator C-terminal domain-containing protein [Microbacterium sp. oral taxon 186]EPD84502.1 hypothetical protein HMPREF1529_01105 [Microbacterium sp. oral taxon 186 str. F0373]